MMQFVFEPLHPLQTTHFKKISNTMLPPLKIKIGKITTMNSRLSFLSVFNLFLSLIILQSETYSQTPPKPIPVEDYTWWYIALFGLVAGLAVAIGVLYKQKKAEKEAKTNKVNKDEKNLDGLSFDADEEMEWLRKNQNIVDRKRRKPTGKKPSINLPKTSEVFNRNLQVNDVVSEESNTLIDINSLPLPIFSFVSIEPSKPFDMLPLSNDEALLSAIEQTQDEDEEDEEVRELAVRILAAFQTRNSVESLSQVALYDLSASLRSKAVTVLTDFNHESVFETTLLACADPTREVRATAARGLTRFSFDRADAWTRILESSEEGQMRHSARAAIEGGFVERSFDRLVHRDEKYSYEAFVLLALIVVASEFDQIIEALKKHHDIKVKLAIIHILKVVKSPDSLSVLYGILEEKNLTAEFRCEIDKAIEEIGLVTV